MGMDEIKTVTETYYKMSKEVRQSCATAWKYSQAHTMCLEGKFGLIGGGYFLYHRYKICSQFCLGRMVKSITSRK